MNRDEYDSVGAGRDRKTATVRSRYDWDAVAPSTAVIETVADATNTEPEALDPLHGHIDPDGLDALFGNGPGNRGESGLFVSFRYTDHEVTIGEDGVITVRAAKASETRR